MSINATESLSEEELLRVIKDAERQLIERQKAKRKTIEIEIKKLADSINADFVLVARENEAALQRVNRMKGKKVDPKYKHPGDASLTWTGRGVAPKWLRSLEEQGRKREEFRIAQH